MAADPADRSDRRKGDGRVSIRQLDALLVVRPRLPVIRQHHEGGSVRRRCSTTQVDLADDPRESRDYVRTRLGAQVRQAHRIDSTSALQLRPTRWT